MRDILIKCNDGFAVNLDARNINVETFERLMRQRGLGSDTSRINRYTPPIYAMALFFKEPENLTLPFATILVPPLFLNQFFINVDLYPVMKQRKRNRSAIKTNRLYLKREFCENTFLKAYTKAGMPEIFDKI